MRTFAAIAALLAVSAATGAWAADADVDVRVTLDPPVIPFHRQVRYTIAVEAPDDVEVNLPDMVEKFGGLAVADIERNTEALKNHRRRVSETYVLDPIFIGDYALEPARVTWGEDEAVTVPSPGLRVRDLTEEEREAAEQFAPNVGPLPIVNPWLRYWPVGAVILVSVALALALLAYSVRRKRRAILETPPLPCWEIAYQRLRELDRRQLAKAGKYEPYYVDLSAILRYYIEDRFLLHAPEQTTPEFLAAAGRSHVFSDRHQQLVAGFLRHCDRVKFAQYVPSTDEMEQGFTVVLQFVDETVPQPVDTQTEAAA